MRPLVKDLRKPDFSSFVYSCSLKFMLSHSECSYYIFRASEVSKVNWFLVVRKLSETLIHHVKIKYLWSQIRPAKMNKQTENPVGENLGQTKIRHIWFYELILNVERPWGFPFQSSTDFLHYCEWWGFLNKSWLYLRLGLMPPWETKLLCR